MDLHQDVSSCKRNWFWLCCCRMGWASLRRMNTSIHSLMYLPLMTYDEGTCSSRIFFFSFLYRSLITEGLKLDDRNATSSLQKLLPFGRLEKYPFLSKCYSVMVNMKCSVYDYFEVLQARWGHQQYVHHQSFMSLSGSFHNKHFNFIHWKEF